jgi:hypothetical protein
MFPPVSKQVFTASWVTGEYLDVEIAHPEELQSAVCLHREDGQKVRKFLLLVGSEALIVHIQ